jgi:DNA-directed RNA polymerase specialized sigma24 family protein
VPVENRNLPQLYRFCFLMTGDLDRAKEVFQGTLRDAALRSARGDPPENRLWFFEDARGRCLENSEQWPQAEHGEMQQCNVRATAPQQIAQLHPEQLAAWISSTPEPQRSAMALYYIDEFEHHDLLAILGLKTKELSRLLTAGRCELQAWLDAHLPHFDEE